MQSGLMILFLLALLLLDVLTPLHLFPRVLVAIAPLRQSHQFLVDLHILEQIDLMSVFQTDYQGRRSS